MILIRPIDYISSPGKQLPPVYREIRQKPTSDDIDFGNIFNTEVEKLERVKNEIQEDHD